MTPSAVKSEEVDDAPMDRLDAAHALLGVSPAVAKTTTTNSQSDATYSKTQTPEKTPSTSDGTCNETVKRPLSDSVPKQSPLDALVALATGAVNIVPSSESRTPVANTTSKSSNLLGSDHSDDMPPPVSRPRLGRLRSASNPEGMEKWDALNSAGAAASRRHFMLPSSILEEELANASAACDSLAASRELARRNNLKSKKAPFGLPLKKRGMPIPDSTTSAPKLSGIFSPDTLGTSPSSVVIGSMDAEGESSSNIGDNCSLQEDDPADLEPEELLRRARARLLEDLTTQGTNNSGGEKGVALLPHSLAKYKEIYNKNGRIGIYTPAERAVIIAKFNSKRSRRVWNKKIRYNCRKNLADRRMRVKGRFVKRSTEQAAASAATHHPATHVIIMAKPDGEFSSNDSSISASSSLQTEGSSQPQSRSTTTSTTSSVKLPTVSESSDTASDDVEMANDDEMMPDVNNPDAGFEPTEDQPFRRTRRYTIT